MTGSSHYDRRYPPAISGRAQANGMIQAATSGRSDLFELIPSGGEKLLVSQANMTGEELFTLTRPTTGDGFGRGCDGAG